MTRFISILLCLFLFAPTAFAETVKLKASSTWTSDAPAEKIVGSAKGKAVLKMNGDDLNSLNGNIDIFVKTMRSGNKTRDEHLRSATWLDMEKYPKITFTIESVKVTEKGDKSNKVSVSGQISIHGVSKPLSTTADVMIIGSGDKRKVKITTEFNVQLGDFNIQGKKGLVGKKVGKSIKVETTLKGIIA